MVNHTDGALNLGLLNLANGDTMADLGVFNLSKSSYAQIGVLNMTDEIKTFQFGVLNMAKNGFLPIFPLFNFPVR